MASRTLVHEGVDLCRLAVEKCGDGALLVERWGYGYWASLWNRFVQYWEGPEVLDLCFATTCEIHLAS